MSAPSHPRVAELVARFQEIAATRMRDLPLYHDALEVEAVGFERCGDALVGGLVTPWFVNLIHLPLRRLPVEWAAVGRKVEHALPGGRCAFTRGGDEVIGRYDAISLHSPVLRIESQARARAAASRRLAALLTPPEADPETPPNPQRRAFLLGRTSER